MKKKMFLGANPEIFENARSLRYNMTEAESQLWNILNVNIIGTRFRRQHPLGKYIADFYCHKYKLVIEVDGSIHNLPEVIQNDLEKQSFFESEGLKVLRFSNNEVFSHPEKILETINKHIDTSRG